LPLLPLKHQKQQFATTLLQIRLATRAENLVHTETWGGGASGEDYGNSVQRRFTVWYARFMSMAKTVGQHKEGIAERSANLRGCRRGKARDGHSLTTISRARKLWTLAAGRTG